MPKQESPLQKKSIPWRIRCVFYGLFAVVFAVLFVGVVFANPHYTHYNPAAVIGLAAVWGVLFYGLYRLCHHFGAALEKWEKLALSLFFVLMLATQVLFYWQMDAWPRRDFERVYTGVLHRVFVPKSAAQRWQRQPELPQYRGRQPRAANLSGGVRVGQRAALRGVRPHYPGLARGAVCADDSRRGAAGPQRRVGAFCAVPGRVWAVFVPAAVGVWPALSFELYGHVHPGGHTGRGLCPAGQPCGQVARAAGSQACSHAMKQADF